MKRADESITARESKMKIIHKNVKKVQDKMQIKKDDQQKKYVIMNERKTIFVEG